MTRVLMSLLITIVLAGSAWAGDPPGVYDKKCKPCHSIGGVAGPMAKLGGALDGVGAKRDEAWLRAYLADPKSKLPDSKMPKTTLTKEELDELVTYVQGLKTPAASQ